MRFPFGALIVATLTAWVVLDAARRQRNWPGWAGAVALTGLVGLIPWLVVRRRSPAVRTLDARTTFGLLATAFPLFVLPFLMALVVTTFVLQTARIEGHAMEPTIRDQDRLLVNKFAYRFHNPRRLDIVMMYYPPDPARAFVKRIMAEEGDEIRIVDGRVQVNGLVLTEPFVPSEFLSHDDWGPQVIPEGYYFVMGDHRNNSSDSRHWGFVPKKYIVGQVRARWWPLSETTTFD